MIVLCLNFGNQFWPKGLEKRTDTRKNIFKPCVTLKFFKFKKFIYQPSTLALRFATP